jgi:Glycosyl hydrolases family 18
MSSRAKLLLPALMCVGVILAGLVLAGGLGLSRSSPGGSGAAGPNGLSGGFGVAPPSPSPTPRPVIGGTELYGYLPYWEMTPETTAYVNSVPLTTLALFSVTARRTGELNTNTPGYERIMGPTGLGLIDDAHRRDVRVELVFTSFGTARNAVFFGRVQRGPRATPGGAPGGPPGTSPLGPIAAPSASVEPPSPPQPRPAPWRRTVDELVDVAVELGVDGINVDVELLDPLDQPAYAEFLVALRSKLADTQPKAQVSVATEAGPRGIGTAAAAHRAGVDRIFLMGYDYHWAGSQPGASSPVERTDGVYDLRWSIDSYVEAGVPRNRILLGLPLYGMTWRTSGPDRTSPVVERGEAWIPRRHLDVLADPAFAPARDALEVAEFFARPDGDEWEITYYDSPATLRAKLGLARDHGLAGGGFWAIGYERGLPDYLELMNDFRDGKVDRADAPP